MVLRPGAASTSLLQRKRRRFLNKRGYVVPEDVRAIANDVLRHRIGLTYEAEAENVNVVDVIDQIIQKINLP